MDIGQVVMNLDAIKEDRKTWEATAFKDSNQQLYGLLDRCHQIYLQLKGDTKLRRQLAKQLKECGAKFNANAGLETQIVTWVFGSCGKRLYNYTRVIKVASLEKPEKLSMTAWIESRGGIDEIRRTSLTNGGALSKEQCFETAVEYLEKSDALATIGSNVEDFVPNANAAHDFALALVRPSKTKKHEIVFGTNNASLVKSVLVAAGKSISKADQTKATEHQAINQIADEEDAISAVVAGQEDDR